MPRYDAALLKQTKTTTKAPRSTTTDDNGPIIYSFAKAERSFQWFKPYRTAHHPQTVRREQPRRQRLARPSGLIVSNDTQPAGIQMTRPRQGDWRTLLALAWAIVVAGLYARTVYHERLARPAQPISATSKPSPTTLR